MKRTYLLGSAVVVAMTLFTAAPTFAKGGGGHGGHGAHGGHASHGAHGGHAHGSAHHSAVAHSHANHGHSTNHHTNTNRSFAHNHSGWNHNNNWGHGWGHGSGRGWGYGAGWGWGHPGWYGRRYAGWNYWGGSGPSYVTTGGVVDPSYYYLNNYTDPVFLPTRTVTRNNVTELVEPVSPLVVPPAPVDPAAVGSQQPVDGSTTVPDAPIPPPPAAS